MRTSVMWLFIQRSLECIPTEYDEPLVRVFRVRLSQTTALYHFSISGSCLIVTVILFPFRARFAFHILFSAILANSLSTSRTRHCSNAVMVPSRSRQPILSMPLLSISQFFEELDAFLINLDFTVSIHICNSIGSSVEALERQRPVPKGNGNIEYLLKYIYNNIFNIYNNVSQNSRHSIRALHMI